MWQESSSAFLYFSCTIKLELGKGTYLVDITWYDYPKDSKSFIVKKWRTWTWLCSRDIHWWTYGTFIPTEAVLTGNARHCLRCSIDIQIWWARRKWVDLERYKAVYN